MNNIDILEEDVKNILNCCTDIETLISLDERAKKDLKNNTHNIQQQEVLTIIREFIRCKNDCSNLIAENKELKEEKEELKRENLEIRDWKYVIDSPIDLDKLKELDLIKIKGKEYISKIIYNELEKDKKALINNYSKILGEFIPKSKVEELIEEVKEDENPSISSFQEYAQEYAIDKLQSLLGKE